MREKIIEAVFRSDINYIKSNLSSANINETDEDGRTPLIHACIDNDYDIANLLIDKGAKIDVVDKENWSAIHYAVQEKSAEIVALLLKSGARVDAQDENGNTPLWRAVFDYDGDLSIISTLIKYGAKIDHSNNHGVSISELVNEDEKLKEAFVKLKKTFKTKK